MSILRRYYADGQVYFITSVTEQRTPVLVDYASDLVAAMMTVAKDMQIDLPAWVILPDHFHLIVDPKGAGVATFVKRVKLKLSHEYRLAEGLYRHRVWQPRFWDHIIRDSRDFRAHADYIHYNPVKHGHVSRPGNWRWSSMGEWLTQGMYSPDWGVHEDLSFDGEFGE